jgi:hypothetical protein
VLGSANDSNNGGFLMNPTTAHPLVRRLAGFAAVPALLLGVAACGDDDDSAGGSFCDQAESLNERFNEIEDPTSEQFAAALDAIREVDPPAEIADDWNTLVSALDGLENIDLENPDPAALAELESAGMQEASDRIDTYMSEECGIEN